MASLWPAKMSQSLRSRPFAPGKSTVASVSPSSAKSRSRAWSSTAAERRVSISPSRSGKGRDQPWRADRTGFGGGRSCGHRSHSVSQCPRGRRYLGSALLTLYSGVDVEGAEGREGSNGLAMMSSLKGARNDDRREDDGQAGGKDRTVTGGTSGIG